MLPDSFIFVMAAAAPGAGEVSTSPTTIILVAVAAAAMGMAVVKLIGYLRKRDAEIARLSRRWLLRTCRRYTGVLVG